MVTQYVIEHKQDVMIVCGYYRILPTKLLNSIDLGVWGIHNSLLPKYRGGSPLVWQIINREKILGSSFFKFSEGMDDGPILEQVYVSNADGLSICEACDQIETKWIDMIPDLWKDFCSGAVRPYEQGHNEATYCAQRVRADGLIDWKMPAVEIDAFIRAQDYPYPRAFFKLQNKIVKIVKHEPDHRVIYGSVGQVFEVRDKYVTICCGKSTSIRLIELEVDEKIILSKNLLDSIKIRLN